MFIENVFLSALIDLQVSMPGTAFWCYLLGCKILCKESPNTKQALHPGQLFVRTIFVHVVCWLVAYLLILCGGVLVAGLLLLGAFGWLIVVINRLGERRKAALISRDYPPPKTQFSTLDLVAATLVFGVAMAVCAPCVSASRAVMISQYALSATFIGFLMAQDVLRWHRSEMRTFGRLASLVGIIAIVAASLIVPSLAAWICWRRALSVIRMRERSGGNALPVSS